MKPARRSFPPGGRGRADGGARRGRAGSMHKKNAAGEVPGRVFSVLRGYRTMYALPPLRADLCMARHARRLRRPSSAFSGLPSRIDWACLVMIC